MKKYFILLIVLLSSYGIYFLNTPLKTVDIRNDVIEKPSFILKQIYLTKLALNFMPEDFSTLFYISDRTKDDGLFSDSLKIARKHLKDYQLLEFVMFHSKTPESINLINSLDLKQYVNRQSLIDSFCVHGSKDPVILNKIKPLINQIKCEEMHFSPPQFIN